MNRRAQSKHNTEQNSLYFTKKNAFLMFRQCLYASAERNNLPHPHFTFTPITSVKLKSHDFAKWGEILLRIICKCLSSLTSDDCWENAIWHVFQTAVLDNVNVEQRLTIVRYSSSYKTYFYVGIFCIHYLMNPLINVSITWWGRESWLFCLICLPGVSWWLSGSSSRCHGVVCGLWLWYFLIILT